MADSTSSPSTITGAQYIARALKSQGVTVVFGLVGTPVVEISDAMISEGIRFISFRHEQSASYAASAWGYLTGEPGVCLVVSGPGAVNGGGVFNSFINNWPTVFIAGSCESHLVGLGAFQELDQVALNKPYTKYSARPNDMSQIGKVVQTAFNVAVAGKPGPVYIDFPADYIKGKLNSNSAPVFPKFSVNYTSPTPQSISKAAHALLSAKSPLIVIGKGAAISRTEDQILKLVELLQCPFLPTPMGKGVVSDSNTLNVSAARSLALGSADVVLVLGARLNWILHFGKKFNPNATIIQADVDPSEINRSIDIDIPLVGHLEVTVQQLVDSVISQKPSIENYQPPAEFLSKLSAKISANTLSIQKKFESTDLPMSYYSAFNVLRKLIPDDSTFISEGANTMDIARSVFEFKHPRKRLDAGTAGTMGIGLGYAISSHIAYNPQPNPTSAPTIAVVGDSAFGFSAIDIETAVRNDLFLIFVVINNNGIYFGLDQPTFSKLNSNHSLPATALIPDLAYHDLGKSLGADGYLVTTPESLHEAFTSALKNRKTAVINCLINPGSMSKIEFSWQKV
ncbi:2-hydroxyacyl-CoA lyase 1 [Smittium mucronatum]|uniref:2-hydroxyacyl-CoA lyase n=1 Tax=Smittium mucronatum TaxID=133383 RepID=A0A1R0GU20_9FUNG|nr:2-hydroxyacyl-CoA lyase 1 [Smittium mucronatum]